MNVQEKFNTVFRVPQLTLVRMVLALGVAVAADGMQIILGPFGWEGIDQAIDFVAMLIIGKIIGFHILLLPTFVLELVPLLDDLPTWTACTAAVIAPRKREQRQSPAASSPPPPPPGTPPPINPSDKPIIDV
jgi:hypothetical protein